MGHRGKLSDGPLLLRAEGSAYSGEAPSDRPGRTKDDLSVLVIVKIRNRK